MILDIGEKVHIIEKRLFAEDIQRHFIGEVVNCMENSLRLKGHVWIYDSARANYIKRLTERQRVVYLSGSLVINVIPKDVDLSEIDYIQIPGKGLAVTDGKKFTLEISEFSAFR